MPDAIPQPIIQEFDTEGEALTYMASMEEENAETGYEPIQNNFETQEQVDEWVQDQHTTAQNNGKAVLKYYIAYWKGVLRYVLILIGFPIPIPE